MNVVEAENRVNINRDRSTLSDQGFGAHVFNSFAFLCWGVQWHQIHYLLAQHFTAFNTHSGIHFALSFEGGLNII